MTIYTDLNFDFEQDDNGELKIKYDLEAIKQSIRNIVLTRRGSRTKYQDPNFGCGVLDRIGEKITSSTMLLIEEDVTFALENYEPRIRVSEVTVEGIEPNTLTILIKYNVISLDFVDEITINLEVIK